MKKFLFDISSLLIAVITVSIFIACASDDNLDSKRSEDSKQQFTFTLTDEDFNADEEVSVTRAGKQSLEVAKDTIDLGNDIFAETTLERDTARDAKPATRAAGMSNGNYTILAYQSGVLKGTLKGTVTSNVFTAISTNQSLSLDPGTYTFYCCNDKVNISGNNITVNRADAGTARIGVTTKVITATPAKQKVDFTMKHVGARIRLKVSGYMPFNANALLKNKDNIPGVLTLDATTGLFTGDNSTPAGNELDSFGFRFFLSSNKGSDGTFDDIQSYQYYYILPETNLKSLTAEFPSVNIYKKTLSNATFTLNRFLDRKAQMNQSFVLHITLKYRYKVLYSDGTTALMNSTWTGHGAPIGIVINDNDGTPNSGTAILFADVADGVTSDNMPQTKNTYMPWGINQAVTDKQGYQWIWEASGSEDGTIKGNQGMYMNMLGNFYSSLRTGSNLSKPYIPAAGEWKEAIEKIFFGALDANNQGFLYKDWFNVATQQLSMFSGTTSYNPLGDDLFYTSTQGRTSVSQNNGFDWYRLKIEDISNAYAISFVEPSMGSFTKPAAIRPFIHF